MTIHEQDIKLLASQVMADVPDGGGGPSGNEIPYGGNNDIFTDVTTADRAGGNVSVRQLAMAVMTPTTEPLLGPSVILSELPTDANVNITLAKCDLFARRSTIAAAIASYLIEGVQFNAVFLQDHVVGQRQISLFHRPNTPTPEINRTFVLSYQAGTINERVQFVRVTGIVESNKTVQTYSASGGFLDYDAMVTVVSISDALRFKFEGSPPSRDFAPMAGKTIVRDTTVADAAEYYGASPLVSAAVIGDTQLRVASVYSQLVPNSRTEIPTLDQRPAATRSIVLAESPRRVEVPVAAHTQYIKINQSNRGFSFVRILRPLPEPGTVTISYRALGNWYTLTDDGEGTLVGQGAGRVIYTTGSVQIDLPSLPDDGSAILIQYGERIGYNNRSNSGAQVRAPEYSFALQEEGYVDGTLTIKWQSAGVTRTATASTNGKLTGDATGEIDGPSGTIYLRPLHMIDPGGQFEITYEKSDQQTEILSVPSVDGGGFATLTLAQQPAARSVQVTWATAQMVTVSSGGSLSSESVSKSSTSTTTTTQVPSAQAGSTSAGVGTSGGAGISAGGYNTSTNTVSSSSSRSGTYSRSSSKETANSVITLHKLTDDGAGNFIEGMGTVAYAGKAVNVRLVASNRKVESYQSEHVNASSFENATSSGGAGAGSGNNTTNKGGNYETTTVGETVLAGTSIVVRYKVGTPTPTPVVETYTPPAVIIDLCPYTQDRIVPGSVQFVWMGQSYVDFEGILYRDRTSTAPGIASGTVNYGAGLATITDWVVSGAATAFTLASLWTQRTAWSAASVFFRTQSAPIKPSSLSLLLADLAGVALQANVDAAGEFTGDHMRGKINFEHGLVELQFGDYVLDSALTPANKAEWWYDAADVGAVQPLKIWRPHPVDPTTLRYSAVAYFYLPLDADIIGLDPVRLPPDGRVPIYRKGSYIIIGHTAALTAATYANDAVINCGRTRLSRVYLVDALGHLINNGYLVNLNAGVIDVVDTTGWVQPVTVKHRIEQMTRATDVQIDGRLQLQAALAHDFPVGSIVSSCVMVSSVASGNFLQARVKPLFDQQTWDGITWADAVVGNPATGTYDTRVAPVVVTNEGAMTERFALKILTGGTDVEVIGEHVGGLGTFSKNALIAPINPISGVPYFSLQAAGWGTSWAAGNVLFVHTVGSYYPFACIRAVQPGPAPVGADYAFDIALLGDINRAPVAPVI